MWANLPGETTGAYETVVLEGEDATARQGETEPRAKDEDSDRKNKGKERLGGGHRSRSTVGGIYQIPNREPPPE